MSGTAPERCRKDKEARKQNERKRPEDADERMSCDTAPERGRKDRKARKQNERKRPGDAGERMSCRRQCRSAAGKDKETRKENTRLKPERTERYVGPDAVPNAGQRSGRDTRSVPGTGGNVASAAEGRRNRRQTCAGDSARCGTIPYRMQRCGCRVPFFFRTRRNAPGMRSSGDGTADGHRPRTVHGDRQGKDGSEKTGTGETNPFFFRIIIIRYAFIPTDYRVYNKHHDTNPQE